MIRIQLKPGREGPVRHGHPWVFSGAIDAVRQDHGTQSAEADLLDSRGNWLGRGLYQADASLALRIYTWNPDARVDRTLFDERIDRALDIRDEIAAMNPQTDAWRLVFAEADGLSGLIVDRYAGRLVLQVTASVLKPFLGGMIERLRERTGCRDWRITDGGDSDGVFNADELTAYGANADREPVVIRENGMDFSVDSTGGQKTGFFLDQRDNRQRVARYAAGRRVLSGFCYTGAFEVFAAGAGAGSITGIDSSETALVRAREHLSQSASGVPYDYLKADVHAALRAMRDRGETFGMVILDPPCFVNSAAALAKGMRAYKDINLLAMKLLEPGGILASFSCSGRLAMHEFKRVLGWSARDAGREVRILECLGQPPDHPVHPCIPETEYLKGVICRVDPL